MVQSAQDRAADDIPGPLNAARDRGILVQRQMSARGIIIILRQRNVAQMAFAEDYDMINAFPPDRTDQPFCVAALPRKAERRRAVSNADRPNPVDKDPAISSIAVPD